MKSPSNSCDPPRTSITRGCYEGGTFDLELIAKRLSSENYLEMKIPRKEIVLSFEVAVVQYCAGLNH